MVEVLTRKERTLKCLQRYGVVIADGEPKALGLLAEAFLDYQKAVPELTSCVDCLYIYRQDEQSPEHQKNDGFMWHYTALDGDLIAIGVSVEALQEEKEYYYRIFGHELCHIEHGDHDLEFHSRLNQIYERLFFECDILVRNDYFGLELRHDSRGGTLTIPPEPPHTPDSNRTFRTGGKRVTT